MSRFPKLTTLVRSAAVALALCGTALSAAPAAAAPPIIDFHFGYGGGGISVGDGHYCLSDRQVRVFLRWQGYENVRFFDRRGWVVAAWAKGHHNTYRVWVDACRARIIDVQWIQHNKLFDEGFTGGGVYFTRGSWYGH